MRRNDADTAATEKERLRARFRSYRDSLSVVEHERLSAGVMRNAMSIGVLESARCVHVYWPMIERREVDTRPLVRWLEDRGAEIVLPVVETYKDDRAPSLRHVRHPGAESLRKNRWGIAEPPGGSAVDVSILDVVIVPALGAGRNGHRVGYGRGFYDAFLRHVTAPCIGLVYHACLVDHVPSEPHDVLLDTIVTEHEIVHPLDR